jgi:hypothetical protein
MAALRREEVVYAVTADQMPHGQVIAATFRY